MKIKLIQFYTPNMTSGICAEIYNKKYCIKHNIDYTCVKDEFILNEITKERSIKWGKIKLLIQELSNPENKTYDYFAFLDIDAFFTNYNNDLRLLIQEGLNKDIIFSNDFGFGTCILNTGLIICKNSSWSKNFFRKAWLLGSRCGNGYFKYNFWHEQSIIETILLSNRSYRKRVHILNKKFNFSELSSDFLFHAVYLKDTRDLCQIAEDLNHKYTNF